jgi:dynein light intermediate chain
MCLRFPAQELLDERLEMWQARDGGICPVREDLYSQAFGPAILFILFGSLQLCTDEILRQVALSCPERGLMLLRMRDQLRMTISAYQTLYKSRCGFYYFSQY